MAGAEAGFGRAWLAPLPVRRLIGWCSRTAWFRRVGPRLMPGLERFLGWLTRGRMVTSGLIMPSLVLYTVGAKSGHRRVTELMCVPDVAADGSQTLLITGSNFAGVNHPGWTYNLLATPAAEIDYRGHRFKVTAVPVPDVERERVWEVLQAQWPKYREYEVASGRKLRIFRLRAVT